MVNFATFPITFSHAHIVKSTLVHRCMVWPAAHVISFRAMITLTWPDAVSVDAEDRYKNVAYIRRKLMTQSGVQQ